MTRDHDSEYYQTQFAERARADVEAALVRSEGSRLSASVHPGSSIVEVWCSRCAEPASVTRAGVALCAFHDGYEQGMAAVLPATGHLVTHTIDMDRAVEQLILDVEALGMDLNSGLVARLQDIRAGRAPLAPERATDEPGVTEQMAQYQREGR